MRRIILEAKLCDILHKRWFGIAPRDRLYAALAVSFGRLEGRCPSAGRITSPGLYG